MNDIRLFGPNGANDNGAEDKVPSLTLDGWREGGEAWAQVWMTGGTVKIGKASWMEMGTGTDRPFWMLTVRIPYGWVESTAPEWAETLVPVSAIQSIDAISVPRAFSVIFLNLNPEYANSHAHVHEKGEEIAIRYLAAHPEDRPKG